MVNQYIPGEETSFTIIAFPKPSIGPDFEAIFQETIRINTLDYEVYKTIQQAIIDRLDEADHVVITGKGENHTNLTVKLHPLADRERETNFENCVADVNIPLGEVFTSPVLTGTNGVLEVSSVYIGDIQFKNLHMEFKDGRVAEYSCENFDDPAQGKALIKQVIMKNHDSLPMGECAIGTNTTAYNPDGKEVIARDNEVSILRKEDVSQAYFNCHTDITIPYRELDEIYGISLSGEKLPIIQDGRFVVPGTELLNKEL